MMTITTSPDTIEIPNPVITAFPKSFSPKRPAIEAFTKLLDITAMSIVDAASIMGRSHSADLEAISCVIASTSASPDMAPRTG